MIIGIGGGTASGKSTLAEALAAAVGESARVVHLDAHFKPEDERPFLPSHVTGKSYMDDNSRDSFNWESFRAEVSAASAEAGLVIIEGLFTLADEHLRDLIDLRIFVDCRADERIVRRLRRNMAWGLDFDTVADVYLDMVRFRHDQNIEPSKWTADLIVNGTGSTARAVELIGRLIQA